MYHKTDTFYAGVFRKVSLSGQIRNAASWNLHKYWFVNTQCTYSMYKGHMVSESVTPLRIL
jgi:hypothetical protein